MTRAGWAQTEITPPLGLAMGGRGSRFTPGTAILDPLLAQALVLEDAGGNRLLWISMDLLGLSYRATSLMRYELAAVTGIPFDAIVINFSHTHSGPMTGFEGYATVVPKPIELQNYENDVSSAAVRLATDAVSDMKPVSVTAHHGVSDIGINRRRRDQKGKMAMGPDPGAFYNPDLWVLDVHAVDGDDRCVLFSYGCHPVIVFGYAWDSISADYPGACRRELEQRLGPRVQAQFMQGLAGNVRPRRLANLDDGVFRPSGPEDAPAVGAQLADDVEQALKGDEAPLEIEIASAAGFAMAPRDQDRILPIEHWRALPTSDDELERNLGEYWAERMSSGAPPFQAVPWGIGVTQLTRRHRIAWLAGEPLAEWLPLLRKWLDDEGIIAFGYCQDGRGYMPTDSVITEGGYEVIQANTYNTTGPGPFAPGINEITRQGFLSLARQLPGNADGP